MGLGSLCFFFILAGLGEARSLQIAVGACGG